MPWLTRIATVTALLLLGGLPLAAPRAGAVDVGSDDVHDQFVGSGSSGSGSNAGTTSGRGGQSGRGCPDCIWLAADPCSSQYNALGCGRVVEGCAPGQEQRRIWFSSDAGQTWDDQGVRCVGANPGASTTTATQELRDAFARAVPPLRLTAEPARGVLPQVPTLFDSGQPAALQPSTHALAGAQVVLRPVARWHWDFGDGTSLDTQVPGSHYPDLTVSHVYRASGTFVVRVRATWTATFTVNGSSPRAVDGSVTQQAQLAVLVGQGRAVLR